MLKHQAYEMLPKCFSERKINFVCRTEDADDALGNFANKFWSAKHQVEKQTC